MSKTLRIYTSEEVLNTRDLVFENEEQFKDFLENENFWDYEVSCEIYDNQVNAIEIEHGDETDIDISDFTINFEDLN